MATEVVGDTTRKYLLYANHGTANADLHFNAYSLRRSGMAYSAFTTNTTTYSNISMGLIWEGQQLVHHHFLLVAEAQRALPFKKHKPRLRNAPPN